MTRVPPLAVVMPVRDVAPYVDAAIESILAQTFGDFEFVIFDDGSRDATPDRLAVWASRDRRIRVVRSEVSAGLAGSSNAAVRASRAPIVARMDGDDVAHAGRLSAELAVFDDRPDTVLVGTVFEGIDALGRRVRSRDRWRLVRRSAFAPFPHGSVMFTRTAFDAVGGYDPRCEFWEDLDLYRRLATRGRVFVLPDALYQYRFHATNVRLVERHDEVARALATMWQTVVPSSAAILGGDDEATHDPRVQYLALACRLWAGKAPGLWERLRWRSLATADLTTAGIFAVAAAAAVSPRATRRALAAFVALRDALAGLRVGKDPVEWHFA